MGYEYENEEKENGLSDINDATNTTSDALKKIKNHPSNENKNNNSSANGNAEGTEMISSATEEQMASMEEVAASAVILAKQAEELRDLIGKFKQLIIML